MVRIPVEDRVDICLAVAHDLASNAAYYISEVAKRSNGGDGYLRAVYTCQEDTAVAERIACAMVCDVGPLLQEALRSRTQGLDAATSCPCWLTICEPDGSTLHHVAFGLSAEQDVPVHVLETIDVAQPAGGAPELADTSSQPDEHVTEPEDTEAAQPKEEEEARRSSATPADAPFSDPPDDVYARGVAQQDEDEVTKPAKDPNEVLDGFAKIIKARRLSRDLQERRDSYLSDNAEAEAAGPSEVPHPEEACEPADEASEPAEAPVRSEADRQYPDEDDNVPAEPSADAPFSDPPDDVFARDVAQQDEDEVTKPAKDPNEVLDGFAKIIKARRLSRDLQERRDSYLSDNAEAEAAGPSEVPHPEEACEPADEASEPAEAPVRHDAATDESATDPIAFSDPPETSPAPADPRGFANTSSRATSQPTQMIPAETHTPAFPPGPCPHSSRTVAKALAMRHPASPRPSSSRSPPNTSASRPSATAASGDAPQRTGRWSQYCTAPPAQSEPQPQQRAAQPQPRAVQPQPRAAPATQKTATSDPSRAPADVAKASPPQRAGQTAANPNSSTARAADIATLATAEEERSRSQSSVFRVAPISTREPGRASEVIRPSRGSHQNPDRDVHRDSFSSYRQDLWRHADSVMTVASALDDYEARVDEL